MQFQNSTVLITGASSGFGYETARLFAKEGARLILLARRFSRLELLKKELKEEFGTESELIGGDVADFPFLEKEINRIKHSFGMPDILINNAGLVKGLDKSWEVKPDQWNVMIDTNIKGVLNLTRLIIPSMLEANKGHVINVGSISGYQTYPGGSVYCATKFAVRALTDTLRMELVATPLRVSMISPGLAETEFSQVRFAGDRAQAEKVYEGIVPLSPQDVAEAILFIASRPPHVTIADLIIFPTHQASVTMIHRQNS